MEKQLFDSIVEELELALATLPYKKDFFNKDSLEEGILILVKQYSYTVPSSDSQTSISIGMDTQARSYVVWYGEDKKNIRSVTSVQIVVILEENEQLLNAVTTAVVREFEYANMVKLKYLQEEEEKKLVLALKLQASEDRKRIISQVVSVNIGEAE